jgi:CRP-like cAMP-binding protein
MRNLKIYIQNLTEFSEESWEILYNCLTELNFNKEDKLLKEGKICNAIFFVSSGHCKATYNQDGKEINTAFYFENDFATNTKSLISGSKSEYDIIACEKMTVIAFDKAGLLNSYKQSQQIEAFGRKLLEIIVSKQEEHSNMFKLLTPLQRYENLVSTNPEFLQRVSLTQTASYLGMSRETLSRLRGK